MKKTMAAVITGMLMMGAHASGGMVQVLDNQVDDVSMAIDLDSVKKSRIQVIEGIPGEKYVTANVKIDIVPDVNSKRVNSVNHIVQKWVISCSDYGYYRMASSSYDEDYNFLNSARLGNDIPLKSEFVIPNDENATTQATLLATTLACAHYESANPAVNHFSKFKIFNR